MSEKLYVPHLTEESYHLLKALYDPGSDFNYLHYAALMRRTGYSREKLKELVDVFRKINIIDYAKGLLTEDGEMYGSGFAIKDEAEHVVELAILRYEQEHPLPPKQLVVNGHKYVLESL